MKFNSFILIFLLIFLNSSISVFALPNSNKTYFAKIESENVFLYNSPNQDNSSKVFEIPKTYFVELLGNAGDTNNLFYYAKYLDISGYVKKDEVSPITETPLKPFANNFNFRVFAPNGLDLKSSPNNQTPFNRITTVPYLSTNLIYYGKIFGEEMIPQKSNVWIYCNYIENNSSFYGYLYSDLCDMIPEIPLNTETITKLEGEIFQKEIVEETSDIAMPKIDDTLKIVIILLVCLPCFALIYLLFRPTKLASNNQSKNKQKIKRLKHAEYYELDD